MQHTEGHTDNRNDRDRSSTEELISSGFATSISGMKRRALWTALETAVPLAEGLPLPKQDSADILIVGCGRGMEGLVLDAFFGGEKYGYGTWGRMRILGIDTDPEMISYSRLLNTVPDLTLLGEMDPRDIPDKLRKNYRFELADGAQLDSYSFIPKKVAVVSFNHPPFNAGDDVLVEMFKQGLKRAADGLVVLTSYSTEVHNYALDLFDRLPAKVYVSIENPGRFVPDASHPGFAFHSHIALLGNA